jgi:hypothetical protein|tara:strand:+ start:144 stop:461 length:318 start_codon:yes stop_codon:yes gene_type:complete
VKTQTMYMTYTKDTFFPVTRPRATAYAAERSAFNQVRSALREKGFLPQEIGHAAIMILAKQFIGATIEVQVPFAVTPREFRKMFCEVRPDDDEEEFDNQFKEGWL